MGNQARVTALGLTGEGPRFGDDPSEVLAWLTQEDEEFPFQSDMEAAFGEDFSSVDATLGASGEMAALGADAAAEGESIAFADASPDAETVAHELAHVVQHRRSGRGEPDAVSSPDDAAEIEAADVAPRAARGESVTVAEAPAAETQRLPDAAASTAPPATRRPTSPRGWSA